MVAWSLIETKSPRLVQEWVRGINSNHYLNHKVLHHNSFYLWQVGNALSLGIFPRPPFRGGRTPPGFLRHRFTQVMRLLCLIYCRGLAQLKGRTQLWMILSNSLPLKYLPNINILSIFFMTLHYIPQGLWISPLWEGKDRGRGGGSVSPTSLPTPPQFSKHLTFVFYTQLWLTQSNILQLRNQMSR